MAAFLYPPTPADVPPSVTAPSAAFKKEVSGVMGSIVFFFIVYILLLVLSIALVVGCFYAGASIIINVPKLITILAGLGLMGVGVMVFIFLVKFLFAVSRYDRSGIIEVTEAEQPALFGFIRQLTQDTQTQFPKKIYLSADVNACVFYDSSFWSMFFPVKKNLQIGLGLVNSVNLSEFKAVMAHEFGHFSQRSMKLGSFVYHVNKIIYNMLFDNKSYGAFLESWAKIDGIFALFASITAGIARGIQGILRGMYGFINKKYMSLSREMEFHADAVAASVSGSASLGTSLRRIEMAASGYDITLNKCDELFKDKKISGNIYPHHTSVLLHMAQEYKLPLKNGLPVVSAEFLKSMNFSRVNFKDQWASHPSTDDRVQHLEELAVPAEIWDQSAWELFRDPKGLQEQLTGKIYEQVEKTDARIIGDHEFDDKLNKDVLSNTFPEYYNGFYDNRLIAVPENGDLYGKDPSLAANGSSLFSEENALLTKRINAAANDLEIVKAIKEKRIGAKSFDFDGTKYDRKEAGEVIGILESELKSMQDSLAKLDGDAIYYFIYRAGQKSDADASRLRARYEDYFALRKKADSFLKVMETMLGSLEPIYMGQSVQIEQINNLIAELKDTHEPAFKDELKEWKSKGAFADSPFFEERITKFINASYIYFHETSFREEELRELHALCTESWAAVNNYISGTFKSLLELQLQYRDQ